MNHMTMQEYDEQLRYDIRTRKWAENEWKAHCIEVAKQIDNDADRDAAIKMINLGWNITVH